MSHNLKPIAITNQQIIAAAIELANVYDASYEYTEAEWLSAVENWLRRVVNAVLRDISDYALGPNPIVGFKVRRQCESPGCSREPLESDIFCAFHRQMENEYGRRWEADAAEQFEMSVPVSEEPFYVAEGVLANWGSPDAGWYYNTGSPDDPDFRGPFGSRELAEADTAQEVAT